MSALTVRIARCWLHVLTLAALVWSLGACAASKSNDAVDAVTAPFSDLNLIRAEIPVVLEAAQRTPYLMPDSVSCATLGEHITDLDNALGADLDSPAQAKARGLVEQGSEAASDAAVGALRRTAEGVIPFRGWVRKLTGADDHARKVNDAITAGKARRAFLKGMATGMACPNPAWISDDEDPR